MNTEQIIRKFLSMCEEDGVELFESLFEKKINDGYLSELINKFVDNKIWDNE